MDALAVCGWDWYRIKGDQRQRMQLCLWTGQSSKPEQKKQEYPEKTDLQRQREHNPSIPYSVPSLYTQGHARVYTHTHTMYPFWHMTIYFPLSNERQAEGMAHILHNFKSQTFFCTCIKLENQLTPQHHLPRSSSAHQWSIWNTWRSLYPLWETVLPSYKIGQLAYSRQKYTVNPQVGKSTFWGGYT